MIVLVDYNNVLEIERRKGVTYVVDRIIDVLDPQQLRNYRRVSIRLYDGWYEGQTLTRIAQQISSDVQMAYPSTRNLVDKTGRFNVLVNVELAYSLRCDPTIHMWHTYRSQTTANQKLTCVPLVAAGCTAATCPLAPIPTLFATGRCPDAACPVTTDRLLTRSGQKMVDTMIVTDMFFSHIQSHAEIAIVTSDDDVWPAIRMLLSRGMRIVHIHTIPGRKTRRLYTRGLSTDYVQLNL